MYRIWHILILIVLSFLLSCSRTLDNADNKDGPPKGTMRLSVVQNGDVLVQCDVKEGEHDIVLKNAVHLDSVEYKAFSFYGLFDSSSFVDIDPYVFIFIQSIDSLIDYWDYIILPPNTLTSSSFNRTSELLDSSFYVEIFMCMFDTDTIASGIDSVLMLSKDLSTMQQDLVRIPISAVSNAVMVNNAVILNDIQLHNETNNAYELVFEGSYMNRADEIFLLIKYSSRSYFSHHCGIFSNDYAPFTENNKIKSIVAFWPILDSRYEQKIFKSDKYVR